MHFRVHEILVQRRRTLANILRSRPPMMSPQANAATDDLFHAMELRG
jgi:hypothetical protein